MCSEPAVSISSIWRRKQPMGGNCHRNCRGHMKWLNKSRHANLIEVARIAFWAYLERPDMKTWIKNSGHKTRWKRNHSRRLALLDQWDKWSEEGQCKGCSSGRYEAWCLKTRGRIQAWKPHTFLRFFTTQRRSLRSPQEIKCQAEVNLTITVLHRVCQSQKQVKLTPNTFNTRGDGGRAYVCPRRPLVQVKFWSPFPRDGRRVPLCLFVSLHVILPV